MPKLHDPYWEITGPRTYLNIPTPVPGRWRASVTWGAPFDTKTVVGWGATEEDAKTAARLKAAQSE